ncbi:MAG: ATP-binding protein [Gemmatimonadota bacterium]|nr:ATP-binding protein [Gemmatimonadota bacterium]
MRAPEFSFRTRILLIVLTVSVVPLALTGLWLTRSAERSGRELLRTRLDEALEQAVSRIGTNWLKLRSDILFLGDEASVQEALAESPVPGAPVPAGLRRVFEELDPSVRRVAVLDASDRERWVLTRTGDERRDEPTLRQELAIHQRFPSLELGRLVVDIEFRALVGPIGTASEAGMVLGAFDTATGSQLLPLPFDPVALDGETFSWGREEWLTSRRRLADPALRLVATAPLSRFSGPFEAAARRGTRWLALVASAGVVLTYLLTRRMTRSLEHLAAGAEAVARGELDVRVADPGNDEIGRVARAFNTMTASLRRTLRELASRERLAAVGEFAASLAHEVRNPLTAIRIDLQRVEESLPPDSPLREAQARALQEIGRLDATVSETLDVARTGRWREEGVDLSDPIRAAADAARHAFTTRGAVLDTSALNGDGPGVRGDAKALEQLFLNLLLNAAESLDVDGRAWIELVTGPDAVEVSVHDDGCGIEEDLIGRVFDPLYTTRADGTGLGLTVVRRIVEEHGGRIEVTSDVGVGTVVRVAIPR